MQHFTRNLLTVGLLLAGIGVASAATDITIWESMDGPLGEDFQAIADDFNKDQDDYHVKLVYKGSYATSMNAGIAAFRANEAPDVLQVFEVGTATMIGAKGAIKPVSELSEEVGDPIDVDKFLPPVAGYYSQDGKLVSMPFNSSTAVMYYNKDAFKQAGLDVDHPPETWPEVKEAALKLRGTGMKCGYTTSWPSWVLLENFAAWNNVPYASEGNGFDGFDAELKLDSPAFVKHMTFLAEMAKDGAFTYAGRGDDPNQMFISGTCGMFTGSSGSRHNIETNGDFDFGTTTLPYYPDMEGAPQNSIIGGASLWVFAGKSDDTYKGVIKFFKFLASPKQVQRWHEATGYVPITRAGYDLTKESGFYDEHPGADVAVKQLDVTETTKNSQGIRLGYLPQIRDVENSTMEDIFAGKVSPEKGLKKMQEKGDKLLRRFGKTVK